MSEGLSTDEQIRLESLRLARRDPTQSADEHVAAAALIEDFIVNGQSKDSAE